MGTTLKPGVRQGSMLGPLLFLIYINDLSEELSSNAELFADDAFLFSVIHDLNDSTLELKNYFTRNKQNLVVIGLDIMKNVYFGKS